MDRGQVEGVRIAYRTVVTHMLQKGYTQQEISEITGIPEREIEKAFAERKKTLLETIEEKVEKEVYRRILPNLLQSYSVEDVADILGISAEQVIKLSSMPSTAENGKD